MGKKIREKFEFGIDFQELILQYTLTDLKGYKALELYQPEYFEYLPHSIIAYTLKKYYKKHKHIPEEAYLKEFLRELYVSGDNTLSHATPTDRDNVGNLISKLYLKKVSRPEEVLHKVIKFAQWVAFREEAENMDVNNFNSWSLSIEKLQKAQSIGNELEENYGTFLVTGITDRAYKRDTQQPSYPTPFWQLNNLLNSGGTNKGNVIVYLAPQKTFKTGALINTARGYLKMRKKGFYVDLENGEIAITTRSEQSLHNKTQEEIQSGEYDGALVKLFRKYRRLGSELVIKRFVNLQTTTRDIKNWLAKLKRDFGFEPDFGIIDYGVLMAAESGKTDDFGRISDAFLDIKNLSEELELEALFTAAHVSRPGMKRYSTRFSSDDIAKCIDIPRHVDAVIGLQQNAEEEEANVMRMEIIEQRNGKPQGRMFFWADIGRQRLKEFSKAEVKEYQDLYKALDDAEHSREEPSKKNPKKSKDI